MRPIDPCVVVSARKKSCRGCRALRAELAVSQGRVRALESEAELLRAQLKEATALVELQRADIDRYKAAYARIQPNTPERVPKDQLQLAFEQVLASMSDHPAAQTLAAAAANDDAEGKKKRKRDEERTRRPHGRRRLDLENLPVEEVVMDPDDVVAAGGKGFELVGEEISDRVAFRPATYLRLRFVRRKWALKEQEGGNTPSAPDTDVLSTGSNDSSSTLPAPIIIPSLPESVWPSFMADPSAVAATIISKYDDYLPLHRQERISERNGFRVPRSTQCGWLGEAYMLLYRIVEAMLSEAVQRAFCIATDATGAPVRADDQCENWHIFVFIADQDHIVFRYSQEHTSEAMEKMLGGFHGHLLADAAPIYDTLHREGAIEVGCWFHLRRYFWRGLPTDPQRALEVLSLIAKLFDVERECRGLALPEYTAQRAARAKPVLDVLDKWIDRNRDEVDPRGPLDQGIGYYSNQRDALHRFLDDGRLRLDNSISEQQLRNAVLGRHNWMFFANETGLKWYSTFRSLIASCRLHRINAHQYLEEVLRLAPHWPVLRVLELSPKYWKTTRQKLDERHRQILAPPWERKWPVVKAAAPPRHDAVKVSA